MAHSSRSRVTLPELPHPARVGINAHLLSGQPGYRQAGIHVYIRQLLAALPADPQLQYHLYTGRSEQTLARDTLAKFQTSRSPLPTERPLYRIFWEQFIWPWRARGQQLDLLHSLAFVTPILNRRPTIVTVYDLSFLHYPEAFPRLQQLYLATQTRRSCRRARRIITISESSRQDVVRFFRVPEQRVDVVYPGVDAAFRPHSPAELAAFRQAKGLPERYFVHVGTLQPRKNIPVLLEALALLDRPDIPLYLVGGKGWLYEKIFAQVKALNLEDRVVFTGFVPEAEVPLWNAGATALIFPSIYEGFGMPVVQAMACGAPVIASDVSSIPEAAGDAALLFGPQDVTTLATHMATVLDRPDVVATMVARGYRQAAQFSWLAAGEALRLAYLRAIEA